MSSSGQDEPGRRIGRYQLVRRLSVGGMAEIYRAKLCSDAGFEKSLVLKCLLPQLAVHSQMVDMFISEARVVARLSHPNVVQVLDFGKSGDDYYIAMEYIEGLDLRELMRMCARRRVRPTTAIAVYIVANVLDALDFAHNLKDEQGQHLNIVHRDISPANILVSHLGEVKLTDFGIAKAETRELDTQPGTIKGKYGYMAPEMITGEAVDRRADLFSIGTVLAELLMIRRLFLGDSDLDTLLMVRDARLDRLYQWGEHIPSALMQILEAALAKDPQIRYQDAATFRDALHRYLFENHLMVRSSDLRAFMLWLEGESEAESAIERARVEPEQARPARDGPISGTEYMMLGSRQAERIDVRKPVQPEAEWGADHSASAPKADRSSADRPSADRPSADRPSADRPSADRPSADRPRAQATALTARTVTTVVGRKRRITLAPPPRPEPIDSHLPRTGLHPRLPTQQALDAVQELGGSGSASDRTGEGGGSVAPLLLADDVDQGAMELLEIDESTPIAVDSYVELVAGQTPLLEGDLAGGSLFGVVFRLAQAEENGMLLICAEGVVKEVYIVDGDPTYVLSSRDEDLFGRYLVSRKVITEHQLRKALTVIRHQGGKLGNTLVQLGLVSAIKIAQYLTQQVREKLLEVFAWEGGIYRYYAGRQCEQEVAPLGWDAFQLLGIALGSMDLAAIRSLLEPLLHACPRAQDPPPMPPEVFRLGLGPRQILEQLDGCRTLEQVLEGRQGNTEQIRLAYLLLQTGFIAV